MKFTIYLFLIFLFGCDYNSQENQMNSKYPISIVYIDTLTETELGIFPIKRNYYAQLIEKLEKFNPKYIILKIFFTDKTDNDFLLIETLKKYDNILTQAAVVSGKGEDKFNLLSGYQITVNSYSFPNYNNAWLPYYELGKHFDGIGFVNAFFEENEFKEFNLFNSLNNKIYPSIPLLILQKEIGKKISIDKNEVKIGSVNIPINSNGSFPIKFSKSKKLYKSYSFLDVLQDKIDGNFFKDNIVIVFLNGEKAPMYKTGSDEPRNVAEIVADAINTALRYLD
jgi:CHASE2 domain-containing sensor protein